MMDQARPSFLTIPPEIREEIYRLILHPTLNRISQEDDYASYNYAPALRLFKVNRQIYHEAQKIFQDLNVFVRIETPWAQAQQHVALEGHVPVVVPTHRSNNFSAHSLIVSIDAPDYPTAEEDTQRFVILVDDLPKFTRMWFYADLTYPHLNENLRLTLRLHDPFTPAYEEKRMSKALQRRFLLPFGEIKGLHETVVEGDPKPYSAVVAELREQQARPCASPEHCLRECARLKQEGNAALSAERYEEALDKYAEAWRAIHIVVYGRRRHIHADRFFSRNLTEPPFQGRNGQSERLMLRVQLVANTCYAYLKQRDYERCHFWGMRTIRMLREAMGAADIQRDLRPEDEAIRSFPGADQMGKIYYRTAVAAKEMGDESEARKLLRVAHIYLPNDKSIQQEIEATALRLG